MRDIPALLMRMSIGPNSFSTVLMMVLGAEGWETSATMGRAMPPEEVISETRVLRSGERRAMMAVWAPAAAKALAVARPMPEEAPVITTWRVLGVGFVVEGGWD